MCLLRKGRTQRGAERFHITIVARQKGVPVIAFRKPETLQQPLQHGLRRQKALLNQMMKESSQLADATLLLAEKVLLRALIQHFKWPRPNRLAT